MTVPTTPTGKRMRAAPHGWNGEVIIAIEQEAAAAERERLRGLAMYPYDTLDGDGVQRGQCQVCGEDGLSEAEVTAFFEVPTDRCCDCKIHVDGVCRHHDRLEAPSDE